MGPSLADVDSIIVACKEHVAHTICDAIIWVRGNIVNKFVNSVSVGFGGRGLLGENGAESDKKFVGGHTSVPEEGAKDTLDAFDSVRVKWRG